MGAHFSMLGVNSEERSDIMDHYLEFLSKYNLEVFQVGIGEWVTGYIEDFHKYKSLKEYDEFQSKTSKQNLSTNHDLYGGFENSLGGWSVFVFNHKIAPRTLITHRDLAGHFSSGMNTKVIEYFNYDVTSQNIVRLHEKGELKDSFSIADFEVLEAGGYFSKFSETEFESNESMHAEVLQPFFNKETFDPDAVFEFENDFHVRWPLYLGGSDEDILRYIDDSELVAF